MLFHHTFLLLLVAVTLNPHALAAGGHLYRWQVANFTDSVERVSIQDDGYDETDFYFPLVNANDTAPTGTSTAPTTFLFPLVVFLQEGMVDKSFYSNFARILSSHGYIVAVPNHLQSILPNTTSRLWPSQRTPSAVLSDVALRSQNASSPLFGIVDTTRAGLCGHSKGGAAALFASSSRCQRPFCRGVLYKRPDAFRATVAISTHLIPQGEPSPSTNASIELGPVKVDNEIPVALIHGKPNAINNVCKSWTLVDEEKDLIVLEGANHWAITNIQDPPGGTPDPYPQKVSQEWSIQMGAKWTAIIFDAYLKHNASELSSSTLAMAGNINNGVMINAHCQEDDPSGDSLNKEDIAAIVIGVSFFVLALVGFGMYFFYYNKQPFSPSGHQPANSTHDNKETPDPSYTELQKHEEDVSHNLDYREQNTVNAKQVSV